MIAYIAYFIMLALATGGIFIILNILFLAIFSPPNKNVRVDIREAIDEITLTQTKQKMETEIEDMNEL